MLYSVVDVGSNTVRLVTYEINGGAYSSVYTDYRALGLISEIDNGKLRESAVNTLCETLALFKKNSPKNAEFLAFATAFMRAITNATEVIEKIKKRTGIELEILSGEEEALYSFRGVMRSLKQTEGVVADFGGGSCEFINFSKSTPLEFTSCPFGCVKLAKLFVSHDVFPSKREINDISVHVMTNISNIPWLKDHNELILTGGTARAFAQMDNFIKKTNLPLSNYTFSKSSFDRLYNEFITFDETYVNFIITVMPNRLKTIYPGLTAIKTIIDYIGCSRITISTEGVREGYLSDHIRR